MITAEMRNMMLRDQLFNDLADIKKEMSLLNKELEEIKLTIQERKVDNGWRHYED